MEGRCVNEDSEWCIGICVMCAGGHIIGKTIYLGFYANETVWDKEQIDRVQVVSCLLCLGTLCLVSISSVVGSLHSPVIIQDLQYSLCVFVCSSVGKSIGLAPVRF